MKGTKSKRCHTHRTVCRRKSKLTEANARSLADMRGIYYYRCPVCGSFHLTKRKQGRKRKSK